MAKGTAEKITGAYVEIYPWLSSDFSRMLAAAIDSNGSFGAAGKRAGASFTAGFDGRALSTFGKNVASAGGMLSAKITAPALAAGTAVGSIFVLKGWDRLTAIDTAQGKLRGLKYSGEEIDGVMASALASVKGTAFGLGDAATVAASALASGIKQGDELTRVLTTIGDVATIAGAGFNDVGNVFNSVMARGKLQGDDMLQLTSRGVPVLQALSKQLGKSTEDVSEMVSEGEIDFKTFEAAMRASFGGAAKASGDTMQGTLANVQAAIGRVGAEFLDSGDDGEGFFTRLKPMLAEAIGGIDGMTEAAGKAGSACAEAFSGLIDAGKGVVEWWDTLDASAQQTIITMAGIAVAAGPVLNVFGRVTSVMGTVVTGVSTGVGAIKAFNVQLENMRIAAALGKDNLTGWGASIGGFVNGSATGEKAVSGLSRALGFASKAVPVAAAAFAAFEIGSFVYELYRAGTEAGRLEKNFSTFCQSSEELTAAWQSGGQQMADTNNIVAASGDTVAQLDQTVSTCENNITQIIAGALRDQRQLRQDEIDDINRHSQKLVDAYNQKTDAYIKLMEGEGKNAQQLVQGMTEAEKAAYLAGIKSKWDEAIASENEGFTKQKELLANELNGNLITNDEFNQRLCQMQEEHNAKLAEINAQGNQAYNAASDAVNQASIKAITAFTNMNDACMESNQVTVDALGNVVTTSEVGYSKAAVTADAFRAMWAGMDQSTKDAATNILGSANNVVQAHGELSEGAKTSVSAILQTFDNLPEQTQGVGKEALVGMLNALGDPSALTGGIDLANASCQEIVDAMKATLQLDGVSREALQAFLFEFDNGVPKVAGEGAKLGDSASANALVALTKGMSLAGLEANTVLGDSIKANYSKATGGVRVMLSALALELAGGDVEKAAEILGGNIDNGLKEGIINGGDLPEEAMGTMSEETLATAREKWGVHSPSTVMAEMGGFIVEGLAQGISDSSEKPKTAMGIIKDGVLGVLGGLPGDSKSYGTKAGQGFSTSLQQSEPNAKSSSNVLAKAGLSALTPLFKMTGDAAKNASRDFANGLVSSKTIAGTNAGIMADAGALMNRDAGKTYGWGIHAGYNFASGLNAQVGRARTAAEAIANAVKGIFGHSIAKEGPLHNHGLGEAEWGRHAVENFASGMLDGIPAIRRNAEMVSKATADAFETQRSGEWGAKAVEASASGGGAQVSNYSINGVTIDASSLEDVLTVQELFELLRRGKEFG